MPQTDRTPDTAVPERTGPATLPRRLRRARELAGLSERNAARAQGVSRTLLRSWESGRATPDTDQLDAAVRCYGADLDRIWPDRRPLVGDGALGHLVVGDERIALGADDTGLVPDNRTILVRYLAAVRRQRSVAPDGELTLRGEDLASLAAVLDLSDESLAATLTELLDLTPTGTRMTMRALAVGSLMALAAGGLIGASWLAPTAPAAGASPGPPSGSSDAVASAVTQTTTPEDPGAAVEISARAVEQVAAEGTTAPLADDTATRERLAFTTEPTLPPTPDELSEIGEAVFAVAPATEWTTLPPELFSVDPPGTSSGVTRERPSPQPELGSATAELPPSTG